MRSGHTIITVNTFDSWGGILFPACIFLKEEFLKDNKLLWSKDSPENIGKLTYGSENSASNAYYTMTPIHFVTLCSDFQANYHHFKIGQ